MELHGLEMAFVIAGTIFVGIGVLFAAYLKLAEAGRKAGKKARGNVRPEDHGHTQKAATVKQETLPASECA